PNDPLGIQPRPAPVAAPAPAPARPSIPAADPFDTQPRVIGGGFDFGAGAKPPPDTDRADATNQMFGEMDALVKQAEDHKGSRLDANEISDLARFYHQRRESQLAYNQQRSANEQAAAAANPGFHPIDAL